MMIHAPDISPLIIVVVEAIPSWLLISCGINLFYTNIIDPRTVWVIIIIVILVCTICNIFLIGPKIVVILIVSITDVYKRQAVYGVQFIDG